MGMDDGWLEIGQESIELPKCPKILSWCDATGHLNPINRDALGLRNE
jgi:hypothetical protein